MAEGYRYLENATDARIAENGDVRVTEGFETGFASLTGSGSVTATANFSTTGSSSLSGAGTITNDPDKTGYAVATLSATGSKLAAGERYRYGWSSLTGTGTLSPTTTYDASAIAALSGAGTLTATGSKTLVASVALTGVGTLSGAVLLEAGGFSNADLVAIRDLENGTDSRITEATDTRVVPFSFNSGASTIVARPSKIDFSGTMSINVDGTWKTAAPWINRSGTWVRPLAVYKNVSGNWKRVL